MKTRLVLATAIAACTLSPPVRGDPAATRVQPSIIINNNIQVLPQASPQVVMPLSQDEPTNLGIGGARVWYLEAYKTLLSTGEKASMQKLLSGVNAYQVGLSYAPQYYYDPVNQEKFARGFGAELNRLIEKTSATGDLER